MSDTKKASVKQEKASAKANGGTVNSGSGNGWKRKNDVRTPEESIECKTTTKKSFSLKLEDLLLAEKNALLDGRRMRFELEMGGRIWVIKSYEDYLAETRGGP